MERMGVGVIGLGVFGELHCKTYAADPRVKLVGVCDIDGERATQRAEQYRAEFSCTDFAELLSREDIAAVSVATPDFAHREIVIAAAEAGKHVLVEKPMAMTVDDCQAMIAAAEKADVTLMVDFHNRFNVPFVATREKIRDGSLGEPKMAYVRLSDTTYVPTTMIRWASKTTVAWFLGVHCVDLLRWLFEDEVRRVTAVSRSGVLQAMGVDTPDFFQSILEFERGGVACVENSWILSSTMPCVYDFKFELCCAKGTVNVDTSSSGLVRIFDAHGETFPDFLNVVDYHGQPGGFGVQSIRHFISVVLGEAEPLSGPNDGLEATRVVAAIHESAEKGAPVDIER